MKDLTVRQVNLNVCDSWQEEVSRLLNQCIIQNPSEEYEEENIRKIIDLYNRAFSFHGSDIDLDDVIGEIAEYNMDIFYKISEIEVHHNPDFFNKSHDGYGGYLSETLQDKIANNADSWYESYYYDNFRLLDDYIRALLYQGRMHYLIPKTYDEHTYLSGDFLICANNCQNILLDKIEDDDVFEFEISCIDDYHMNLPGNLDINDYLNNFKKSLRIFYE